MRRTKPKETSLFAARQRGGAISAGGYNFQDAYIVTALPTWLSDPAFRSILKEGFDDIDVRFEGARGAWTWHYQLKDHAVGISEFREVVERFAGAAIRPELNAVRFVLGCCG